MARPTALDVALREVPERKGRLTYTHPRQIKPDTEGGENAGEPQHEAEHYGKAATARRMIRG